MPAPTPIRIQYGRARDLANLAAAAGSASFSLGERRRAEDMAADRQRMEYQGWLQRLAGDREFVSREMDRRAQGNQFAAEYDLRSRGLMAEEEASRRAFELQQAAATRAQLEARRSGSATTASRATTPVTFAPTEDSRPSSAYVKVGDKEFRRNPQTGELQELQSVPNEGLEAAWGPVRSPQGGGVTYAPRQPAVNPTVQGQLSYLRSIQTQLPPDQWNAMWVAAQSGQLTMDQLIDNARMAGGTPSERMTATDRSLERYRADYDIMSRLASAPIEEQLSYARRRLNMTDTIKYGDEEVAEAMQRFQREVLAVVGPVQNSHGRTPTGGNPIRVNSPEEADRLPSGTYFQTPDGRVMRVP